VRIGLAWLDDQPGGLRAESSFSMRGSFLKLMPIADQTRPRRSPPNAGTTDMEEPANSQKRFLRLLGSIIGRQNQRYPNPCEL
jgi:hypothetical protein